MKKLIAYVQIGLGILGLVVWAWWFTTSYLPAQEQLLRLDRIANDAGLQADLAVEVIDRGSELLVSFEQSAALHHEVLRKVEQPLELATASLAQWERDLQVYSKLSLDASQIAGRLARQVPIRIPDIDVKMQETSISIPELEVQEQTVRIPVPKVKAGTRAVNLNLGLTELNVDVPTLSVSTEEQTVVVPKTAQLGTRVERLRTPSSIDVNYRELFAEEGQMLSEAADQLSQSSESLKQSAETIGNAHRLMNEELPNGLKQTQLAVQQTQDAIGQLRTQQLPTFRETIQRQRVELDESRGSLQQLSRGIPWLFALLGLIPLAVLLQGVYNVRN